VSHANNQYPELPIVMIKPLLICYGTRPEYIKISPILHELRRQKSLPFRVLFTGQHKDIVTQEADITIKIEDGNDRLDNIVTSILKSNSIPQDTSAVLVQGDTTSALAIALSAFHKGIPVIHLEAGLRTYDKKAPFPEEVNRQMISRIASLHLCPTKLSESNLHEERVNGEIYIVGNTVLDHLVNVLPSNGNTVVITMHRRENQHNMKLWFKELDDLAKHFTELSFVLPIHPSPEIQKFSPILKHVQIAKPMSHVEFIKMLAQSRLVITDSGGIQEEAAFLKKFCIVCREHTGRKEGLGHFAKLCTHPALLEQIFRKHMHDMPTKTCPYGDGHSGKRVSEILSKYLSKG